MGIHSTHHSAPLTRRCFGLAGLAVLRRKRSSSVWPSGCLRLQHALPSACVDHPLRSVTAMGYPLFTSGLHPWTCAFLCRRVWCPLAITPILIYHLLWCLTYRHVFDNNMICDIGRAMHKLWYMQISSASVENVFRYTCTLNRCIHACIWCICLCIYDHTCNCMCKP